MKHKLDRFTDVPVNILHIKNRVTRYHFAAGLGGLILAVAVQEPVIGQEKHEGFSALPFENSSEHLSALR